MKWVILGLAVVGIALLALGYHISNRVDHSTDENLAAVIPWLIGIVVLGTDFVLLIGFVIYKAFAS